MMIMLELLLLVVIMMMVLLLVILPVLLLVVPMAVEMAAAAAGMVATTTAAEDDEEVPAVMAHVHVVVDAYFEVVVDDEDVHADADAARLTPIMMTTMMMETAVNPAVLRGVLSGRRDGTETRWNSRNALWQICTAEPLFELFEPF